MKKLTNNNRFLTLIIGLVLAVFLTSCSKDSNDDVVDNNKKTEKPNNNGDNKGKGNDGNSNNGNSNDGGYNNGRNSVTEILDNQTLPPRSVEEYFDKIKDEASIEKHFKRVNRKFYWYDGKLIVGGRKDAYNIVTFDSNLSEEVEYEFTQYSPTKKYRDENRRFFEEPIFYERYINYPAMWNVQRDEQFGVKMRFKTTKGEYFDLTRGLRTDYKDEPPAYTEFKDRVTHVFLYKTSVEGVYKGKKEKHYLYLLIKNPTREIINKIESKKVDFLERGKFHIYNGIHIFVNFYNYNDFFWND
jgi:putative proline-rich receptor-like protein kinase PERK6